MYFKYIIQWYAKKNLVLSSSLNILNQHILIMYYGFEFFFLYFTYLNNFIIMLPNFKIYLTVDCLINLGADVLYSFFVLELIFFGITIGLFYHSYFMRDNHNRQRISAELPIFKEVERTLVKGEQIMGGEKVTLNLEYLGIALIDYVVETRARGQIYVQNQTRFHLRGIILEKLLSDSMYMKMKLVTIFLEK